MVVEHNIITYIESSDSRYEPDMGIEFRIPGNGALIPAEVLGYANRHKRIGPITAEVQIGVGNILIGTVL